ncbi:MAG: MBL fold metallo-hydrolase [Oscillospiraceae bacterium]|nr:MBL fold metallo-hydrolase [Oscillospiraceae bacterium]
MKKHKSPSAQQILTGVQQNLMGELQQGTPKKYGKYAWIIVLILIALILFAEYGKKKAETPSPVVGQLQVYFLDVGQADSALILCEDHSMLIDGGNVGDGEKVASLLKEKGIKTLDYVICTHAHEDHVGGLAKALGACNAKTVLCPVKDYDSTAFRNFAKKAGDITVPKVGSTYALGDASFRILACDPAAEETNNTSIVLRLSYGSTSFLFTGDAEYEVEQTILEAGYDLSAHVLKVGHHGSSSSTSYRFLNAVMPQYAVISVGEDNSYGHPDDVVLSRLSDADVTTYRTDRKGDLLCISDGSKISFSTP